MRENKIRLFVSSILLSIALVVGGCTAKDAGQQAQQSASQSNLSGEKNDEKTVGVTEGSSKSFDLSTVPAYSGQPYVAINNNVPFFNDSDLTTKSFENYSELDDLGRCGVAYANVCKEIMPTEKRGPIGMIKPSGWKTVKYDNVDGHFLYNRCHLVGHQLAGKPSNCKENLITGTRYMNVDGMLPFENLVADYVKETNHHVLYRVTPIFNSSNLVASGVLMEAKSVEDNEVEFCVYCYNVQPGIEIDYATGDSHEADSSAAQASPDNNNSTAVSDTQTSTYVINENTKKFHRPDCASVTQMNGNNKREYTGTRQELLDEGYSACKSCNP